MLLTSNYVCLLCGELIEDEALTNSEDVSDKDLARLYPKKPGELWHWCKTEGKRRGVAVFAGYGERP